MAETPWGDILRNWLMTSSTHACSEILPFPLPQGSPVPQLMNPGKHSVTAKVSSAWSYQCPMLARWVSNMCRGVLSVAPSTPRAYRIWTTIKKANFWLRCRTQPQQATTFFSKVPLMNKGIKWTSMTNYNNAATRQNSAEINERRRRVWRVRQRVGLTLMSRGGTIRQGRGMCLYFRL